MMLHKKIAFYYEKLGAGSADDIPALIDLHIQSFERHGWEVVLTNENDARRHPMYENFNDQTTILGRSRNQWEYTRACYMRWLAYAILGYPFADLDVINYGFSPVDADNIRTGNKRGLPIFLSAAGAIGLLEREDYRLLVDTYLGFILNPVIEGPLVDDINDMTIMRHLHPEWYNCIPYLDDRFAKDYSLLGWETARLVHYPQGLTKSPRAVTITQARSPLV